MNWNNEGFGTGMPLMGMMVDNVNLPPMNPPPPVPLPLIGPIIPENMNVQTEDLTQEDDSQSQENQANDVTSSQNQRHSSRDRSNYIRRDYRDKNSSDCGRYRSRSRDSYDRYRSDRSRNDRTLHEPKSKWDDNDKKVSSMGQGLGMGNMNQGVMNMGMMSGMMQYPAHMMNPSVLMNNMMAHPGMEGHQMMIPNMNIMGNMMPNMIDQNMLMMNQQVISPLIPNQPIYMTSGVLLPPIPGIVLPKRRERPKGCRTIFIGGLPTKINTDALNEMFSRFGNIQEVKLPKNCVNYVRFVHQESVENSFCLSGYRFRFHNQLENDTTTIIVDYALNRDDQYEYERSQWRKESTPPRIEPFNSANLTSITEKIKSETDFADAAPTLTGWLERGECNKKFANQFYSLIQASNNQIRRLFNEKMQLDEDFQNLKSSIKDKFAHVVNQFEQVAKILSAAKHQRVSDHFTKQQRRNIDMWLKMTEEVKNIKEEYNAIFEEEEIEKPSKNSVSLEKYEELKKENENLTYELEGYKNEAYLAKDEAEKKFEKFKAHFIAQQALQNKSIFPPLPQSKLEPRPSTNLKPNPAPPTPDDDNTQFASQSVPQTEARLISILTAFLIVHPLGASLDYLVSYVKSLSPNVTQATVLSTLQKYTDIFKCKTTGVGACIEHRWYFVTFDIIKSESHT